MSVSAHIPLSSLKSTILRNPIDRCGLPPKHGLRKVVVLGAGVSKPFGLPLANNLLEEMVAWQIRRGKAAALTRLYEFLEYFYPSFRRNRPHFPPAEDVLAMMDVALDYYNIRKSGTPGNPWRSDEVTSRRTLFLKMMSEYLWSFQDSISLDDFLPFRQFVRANGTQVIYITFNYDLLLESALSAENIPFSYSLPFARDGVSLLKPHGSVNWFVKTTPLNGSVDAFDFGCYINPHGVQRGSATESIKVCATLNPAELGFRKWKEPVIIPPTPMKQIENPDLKRIWASFSSAIHGTPRLEILGYSLPSADRLARLILRKAGPPHHHNRDVTIVNPGRVKKVYQEAIWKGCKFVRITFNGWVARGCV